MRILSSRQPCYLPSASLIRRLALSHIHVISDDVAWSRGDFENRQRFPFGDRIGWLTVPVHANDTTLVRDVEVDHSQPWARKHWKSIQLTYGRSPHFDGWANFLEPVYRDPPLKLTTLNLALLEILLSAAPHHPMMVRSSDLDLKGCGSERVLSMCQQLGATHYLAGVGAQNYLDMAAFDAAGVQVMFQPAEGPELSCLGALFQYGAIV